MRVIAGTARGRRLRAVKGFKTRPTSDRVKETLFNILADRVVGASFLDLFAGSGDVGIEALSRGAERVVFVDASRRAARVIRENLDSCGISDGYQVLCRTVASALNLFQEGGERFDLIFLDPPYASELAAETLERLSRRPLLREGGLVIAEHHHKTSLAEEYGTLSCSRRRKVGETALSFYSFRLD